MLIRGLAPTFAAAHPTIFIGITVVGVLGFLNQSITLHYAMQVELVDKRMFLCPASGCGAIPDEQDLWK